MPHPLLQIKNLSVSFQQDKVVNDISLYIKKAETLAVVGESGSGKSITSLSVLKLLPPNAIIDGDILFNQNDKSISIAHLSQDNMQQIRGNKIAMIFQEPMTSLNPVKTCGNQVSEAILLHKKINKKDAQKQTVDLFDQVQLPNPKALYSRYPHEISGGQKQRVMIAMAMSCQPDLLICDESTTALDVLVQKEILLLIKNLQQQTGMSVLFISHDLNLVAEIADRIAVFYKGNLVEMNTANQIIHHPKHAYTKALLACRPALYGKNQRLPVVSDFLNNSNNETEKKLPDEKNIIQPKEKNILLSVKNLNTWYVVKQNFFNKNIQYNKAVNNVSFDVYEGEMLGLVGGSGCGKTTLGRSIMQLVKPQSGEIIFKGRNILQASHTHPAAEMQMIFQDPYASLNPKKPVGDAIAEPLRVHKIYPEKEIKNKVCEWLEKVGLDAAHYHHYPHRFSGGQRQRIVIARALIMQPNFVVCDECIAALDVSVQAQILNLLNDLKKEMGFTAVFISHDLSVVKYICDRVIVMNKGFVEEIGNAEDVYFHPESEYAKQLLQALPKVKDFSPA